jgi:hypothetical protein
MCDHPDSPLGQARGGLIVKAPMREKVDLAGTGCLGKDGENVSQSAFSLGQQPADYPLLEAGPVPASR